MLLVRTGGIFGVIVALIIAAISIFVIRPAVTDTTDRALDTANRAISSSVQQTADIRNTIDAATADVDGADFLSRAAFAAVVTDIRSELGAGAELLDLTVNAAGGNVKYRTGERAAGFRWGTGVDGLEPVEVTLVGPGEVGDNVFPIARLEPDATGKLAAAVAARAGTDFEISSMTLGLAPVTGTVTWTVTGEGDGRASVFTAKADTTGLKQVG